MGLDTSCNIIKDVLSLPTVSHHQTWVTCMCKYHKNNINKWDWTQVVAKLKTSFPCLQCPLIKRGSLVSVNITKIT